MRLRLDYAATCVAALWIALASAQSSAHAQPAEPLEALDPGAAPDALPGVRRVALPEPFDHGFTAAGTLAYGYTEAIERLRDAHHRLVLDLAGSYGLSDAVALGASLMGHYDAHSGGASDGDSSVLVASRVYGRGRLELDHGLSLGAELAIGLPAADSVGRGLAAISPELRALASYGGFHPRLLVGGQLGVRLDRSGEGVEEPERLAAADRIALSASDSSALLFGVAGTYAVSGRWLVLGELGWDVLVGSHAPAALESPMRITGGVRYALTELLALDAFLTLSPSGRPEVALSEPLLPVEPRVLLGVGVSARWAKKVEQPSTLIGHIVDELGQPLPGAQVIATDVAHARTLTATTDGSGAFTIAGIQGTRLALQAQAEHRVPGKLEIALTSSTFDLGDWPLPRGRGALVGRVIGPDGLPRASVTVRAYTSPQGSASDAPPIAEMLTTEDGSFALRDLPAGPMQLAASALGLRDAYVDVVVPVQQELVTEITLLQALPEGQIRGTVRGFGGQPLTATIRIEPLGLVLNAERDGTFSVDVAPGRYEVLVTAPGYDPQQRFADVERDGVTVLPIDLVRQP